MAKKNNKNHKNSAVGRIPASSIKNFAKIYLKSGKEMPISKKEYVDFCADFAAFFNSHLPKSGSNLIYSGLGRFDKNILDDSPISILIMDENGFIIAANRMARKMIGKPLSKIVNRRIVDTKDIKNNSRLVKCYDDLLKNNKSFTYDNLEYISEVSGQKAYLYIHAAPIFSQNGKFIGAMSMALDNTEAILAKQELINLNDSLERKVAERTQELSKALSLQATFISDASHELRTPLTIIQGNFDILRLNQEDKLDPEVKEIYDTIDKELELMINILTELSILTNSNTAANMQHFEEINLCDITQQVVQSIKVLADKKNINLEYICSENPYIMGDMLMIEKLLHNLIRNAIKYTGEKGTIMVVVEKHENTALIRVKDTGIGIPNDLLENIFERFYRVDSARNRKEGGTGLGLAISKLVAENHGGRITVNSKIDVGSEFIVHLPTITPEQS